MDYKQAERLIAAVSRVATALERAHPAAKAGPQLVPKNSEFARYFDDPAQLPLPFRCEAAVDTQYQQRVNDQSVSARPFIGSFPSEVGYIRG